MIRLDATRTSEIKNILLTLELVVSLFQDPKL